MASVANPIGMLLGYDFLAGYFCRVCVRTAKAKLQRLKPHSFCGVYVVAKATTHKQSRVATQTLKPSLYRVFEVAAEEVAEKLKTLSFRGTLRAEESLFSCVSSAERFLTSFGMTIKDTFSAASKAATHN